MNRGKLLAALALLALIGASIALALYEKEPESAPEQLARARKLARRLAEAAPEARQQAFDGTIAAYDRVEAFPDQEGAYEAALREAFDLLLREKQRDRALERARRLLARRPPPEDAPALLLRTAEETEAAADFPKARELYLEVAKLVTTTADLSADAAFRAAVILEDRMPEIARGDVIASWKRFIDEHPKSKHAPEALLRLAALYREVGEKELAIATYRRVADDWGDTEEAAKALREIGIIYGEELGKHREAAKAFEELEEKHPDSAAASGARARRESEEGEASKDEEGEYGSEHYGGSVPDFTDMLAKTPREELAGLIAMKLDIERLDVDISLAPEERRMAAEAALAIRHHGAEPRSDLAVILAMGLTVTSVTLGGEAVAFEHQGQTLKVTLEKPWPPEETRELRVVYATDGGPVFGALRMGADGAGFGVGSAGAVPVGVVGDMFPVRAGFHVPKGWSVVSTGAPEEPAPPASAPGPVAPRASTRTASPGEEEARFVISSGELPVFSLYFAYGPFQERRVTWRGRPLAVKWLTKTFTDADADEMLAGLADNLDFYAERFGDLPWPCFTIVEASVHEVGAAGIGPATMLLLFPQAFGKDETAIRGSGLPKVRNLMAHELAHQWWGNAVPVTLAEGWAPWLSEGMASYADALYLEKREGHDAMRRHLTKYAHLYYQQMLSFKDRPLAEAWANSPSYRSVAYEKGARVLHMLRRACGDGAFFAGLHRYATEFRWKDSTIDDLRACLEATSGKDLRPFFDDWVRRAGFPRILVQGVTTTAASEPGRTQVRVEVAEDGVLFRVPRIDVRFEGPTGTAAETREMALAASPSTLTAILPFVPERVVVDPEDDVLKLPGIDTEWSPAAERERAVKRGGGRVGRPAPHAVFDAPGGGKWDLDARRGSVVVLCVYETQGKPSQKGLEELDGFREALESGGGGAKVVLLAVAEAPLEEQRRYLARFAPDLPYAEAGAGTLDLFEEPSAGGVRGGVSSSRVGIRAVPSYVFVDAEGVVRARREGVLLKGDLLSEVEPLLK